MSCGIVWDMAKLTLHNQKIPSWFGEFVNRAQGGLPFLVGVDVFPNVPGLQVFGRTYLPDGESNELVNRGAAGADAWIDRFYPVYAANPHVARWIGPNEYVLRDSVAVERFNAFHVRYIERMSALGHGVVCGQINTGWPRLRMFNDPPPYPEALAPTLGALYAHGGLFSLHEYGPGDMRTGVGAHCLRYRNTRKELLAAGVVNLPDFVITETGIDVNTTDPNSDYNHWGWRHFTDWPGYFDQLCWYSDQMEGDPYMLGASIFTVADDWFTFQINEAEAMPLADWIAQDEPQLERARGIDVSQWQGEIDHQAVADSGVSFAFVRCSVGDRIDPCWEANYKGFMDAGILVGAYHYLEPLTGGQAGTVAKAIEGKKLPLGVWIDIEDDTITDAKCASFFEYLHIRGVEPAGIYTSKSKFDRFGSPGWAEGLDLWVAHWGLV